MLLPQTMAGTQDERLGLEALLVQGFIIRKQAVPQNAGPGLANGLRCVHNGSACARPYRFHLHVGRMAIRGLQDPCDHAGLACTTAAAALVLPAGEKASPNFTTPPSPQWTSRWLMAARILSSINQAVFRCVDRCGLRRTADQPLLS